MKRLLLAALWCAVLFAPALADDADSKKFPRGAKPSPRHKLIGAPQHQPLADVPAQIAYVPATLDMWGNNQFGDCVTAEECFAKACHSPEIFVTSADAEAWAKAHGYLNGADLVSVLTTMQTSGLPSGGAVYDDGPYSSVDYSNEAALQSAISVGPVKIAIDANALPSTAGSQQGWYAVGGSPNQYPNTDHCVSICGYGPAQYLYSQLQLPTPAALANTSGYLVFTWSSIGFVDHAWLMSTTAEAWLRNPTTVGGPTPTPSPSPKHRLTFAELIQLLIARHHPHLKPWQLAAIEEFFADPDSPRVKLLERIVYRRARHAGLNLPDIGAVNWQELIKILVELEPIIVPLIPVLFGEQEALGVRRRRLGASATLCAGPQYRKECGVNGCKLVPIESPGEVPSPGADSAPTLSPILAHAPSRFLGKGVRARLGRGAGRRATTGH